MDGDVDGGIGRWHMDGGVWTVVLELRYARKEANMMSKLPYKDQQREPWERLLLHRHSLA